MSKEHVDGDHRNGDSTGNQQLLQECKSKEPKALTTKKDKQTANQSFSDLVRDSGCLPEIRPGRLPATMTEILKSSPKDLNTSLPQIRLGQLQLVTNSSGEKEGRSKANERRRRREKKKLQPHRRPSPTVAPKPQEYGEKVYWKKKLHRRPKKRLLAAEGQDNVSVTREFRLPALQEVRHVHPS